MAKKKQPDTSLSQAQIIKRYGVPKSIIRKYFPKSGYRSVRAGPGVFIQFLCGRSMK